MFNLENKVAVITGARRGMGKSHALILAKQGATVVVTDINQEECEAVVKEIQETTGREAYASKLDVSSKEEVDTVFTAIVEKLGRVDILVNNAGIFDPHPALELSEADWERTININLKGQFLCAQRAAKEMIKNKWGRIINIASVASGQVGIGFATGVHYTASKGGISAMTETLAIELAPHGVLVNTIAPGMIDTPMADVSGMSETELNQFVSVVPLRRIGKSEEVSALVAFLASEEASYVTGAWIPVDGGWLAN